jgi:hypothetical protein
MYSQTIKIKLDKDIIQVILKKLRYNSLDDYINDLLQKEILNK